MTDKLYYKVGEVSSITGLPPYVLRFWESEFTWIRPRRTPAGQRLYRKRDIELILKIKHLLYEKRYTIPGARQHLKAASTLQREKSSSVSLEDIRSELEKIRDIIS